MSVAIYLSQKELKLLNLGSPKVRLILGPKCQRSRSHSWKNVMVPVCCLQRHCILLIFTRWCDHMPRFSLDSCQYLFTYLLTKYCCGRKWIYHIYFSVVSAVDWAWTRKAPGSTYFWGEGRQASRQLSDASTPNFHRPDAPSCCPTNRIKALKGDTVPT